MKQSNVYSALSKIMSSSILCTGILVASLNAHGSTLQDISQVPLSLAEGVPPNMLLTLDDSGSMRFAFAPDNISEYQDTRRAKSSHFNPMYYNPDISYQIPPFFDTDGKEVKLTTSFTEAYHNGFRPSVGSTNLSRNYRVSWDIPVDKSPLSYDYYYITYDWWGRVIRNGDYSNYTGIGITPRLAQNPSDDFKSSRDDKTRTSVYAYYYNFKEGPHCSITSSSDKNKELCYELVNVNDLSSKEKQNFAIWYSFYRNRALATISAAAVAFYKLSPDVRISWQAINKCQSFDTNGKAAITNRWGQITGYKDNGCGNNLFAAYTAKQRGQLYSWLQTMPFDGGTPLRASLVRAGEFLQSNKAWHKYPNGTGNTSDNIYACRSSYHILMTDGMWNGSVTVPGNEFKHDNVGFTLPDNKTYTPKAPYKDSTKNNLADLAMHYWATDLNSSLENEVPPYIAYKNNDKDAEYWDPRNNPATWQSMTNFIVGLALTNSLNKPNIPWSGSTHAGIGYRNLSSGNATWPVTADSGDNNDNNVYDLWHAAINSRGEFYSADSPEGMVQAFDDILTRIANRKASAAAPAAQGALEPDSETEGAADRFVNYFYTTTYDSENGWAGDVKKIKKYRQWNNTEKAYEDIEEDKWSAAQRLPVHSARNIMMVDGTSGLQSFSETNAGSPETLGTLASWLRIDPESGVKNANWRDRLKYLRGDRSKEGEEEGDLRQRSSVLGDFLSSKPVVVSGARYLENITNRLEGNEAYSAFIEQVANRRPQLYVGGNSGMLHAFDAETGVETFAFVPTAVFPVLNKLTGQNYSHQYYVDGSPVIADVYDGSKWRTILVGTLRAGGKGLFALDVTDPDNIKLLWELDTNSDAVKKLAVKPGYSFPKPTVARLHNGKWAVVTGNGYKAEGANNGAAALYIIDAISGEMIKSLEVQSATKEPNGLSTPRLADYDSDGVADYAYAGDLHGNLWRFDLLGDGASAPTVTPPKPVNYGAKNGGTSKFSVSYNDKPLFTATSSVGGHAQPITSAPSLVRHPTGNGYLIVVGTGRYVEIGDKTAETSYAQSLYGIWDTKTKAEPTTSVANAVVTRSDLVAQSITEQVTAVGGKDYKARIITNNPIEWHEGYDSTNSIKKHGWYLDLKGTAGHEGEMMIEDMTRLGNTLFVQTLIPNDDPCAYGSTSWHYAINPATGGHTLHHAWTEYRTQKPGQIIAGLNIQGEGGITIVQRPDGTFELCTGTTCEKISPDPASIGRQTWRVVPDP